MPIPSKEDNINTPLSVIKYYFETVREDCLKVIDKPSLVKCLDDIWDRMHSNNDGYSLEYLNQAVQDLFNRTPELNTFVVNGIAIKFNCQYQHYSTVTEGSETIFSYTPNSYGVHYPIETLRACVKVTTATPRPMDYHVMCYVPRSDWHADTLVYALSESQCVWQFKLRELGAVYMNAFDKDPDTIPEHIRAIAVALAFQ